LVGNLSAGKKSLQNRPSFEQEESNFTRHVEELRTALKTCDPTALSESSGCVYEPIDNQSGVFHLLLWNQPISISFPDLIAFDGNQNQLPIVYQALVLYYLRTARGSTPSGRWISFSGLPNGKFYNQAFQGYSGMQLARVFGDDLAAVQQGALQVGGRLLPKDKTEVGDFACLFQVLPFVPVLLVGWQGDEDFPAAYQFLFDATAANYLPTDVCAIIGGMLARKIIAAHQA